MNAFPAALAQKTAPSVLSARVTISTLSTPTLAFLAVLAQTIVLSVLPAKNNFHVR